MDRLSQTYKITNYFLSILFILLPFSIVSGPFLPDLTFVIFAIYLLFNYEIIFKFLKKYKFLYIIIFFWLIILVESFFSKNFYYSFPTSLLYIRFLLGSLGIAVFLIKNEKNLLYFGYSLILCFIILIIDGFYQFYFKFNLIGIPIYASDRLSSFFGDELKLGSYLSRFMPLFFFFVFKFKEKIFINIYFALLLLILLDILIYLSGERVAFGYLILATVMMVILLEQFKILRLITFIISLFLIYFISNNFIDVKNRMIDQTIEQLGITEKKVIDNFSDENTITTKDKFYAFTPHHHSHYTTALKIFKLNPLFGSGSGSFRYECTKINPKSCSTHQHNTYIQLLSDNGIFGFIPIFFLFIFISYILIKDSYFFYFKKIKTIDDANLCLILCFFISLWPLVPTGSFYNNWLNILYYLPLSIYIYINFKEFKK